MHSAKATDNFNTWHRAIVIVSNIIEQVITCNASNSNGSIDKSVATAGVPCDLDHALVREVWGRWFR